jgi:ABC-type ATPase involved in cell division
MTDLSPGSDTAKREPTLRGIPIAPTVATVELRGVEVAGGLRPALARIDLSVPRGEWLHVHGPVAAGKSLLLRVLAGRLRPAAGSVWIAGEPIAPLAGAAWRQLRRSIGEMSPDLPLVGGEDALTNVCVVEWICGAAREEAVTRARAALACVGLDPGRTEGRACALLSTGERRLVELARALARKPALLVLDDLLEGLDAPRSLRALQAVQSFRAAGVTVISSGRGADGAGLPGGVRWVHLRDGEAVAPGLADGAASGAANPRVEERT